MDEQEFDRRDSESAVRPEEVVPFVCTRDTSTTLVAGTICFHSTVPHHFDQILSWMKPEAVGLLAVASYYPFLGSSSPVLSIREATRIINVIPTVIQYRESFISPCFGKEALEMVNEALC